MGGSLTAPPARHRPVLVRRGRACGRGRLALGPGKVPRVAPPPRSPPGLRDARPPHRSRPSCPLPGSGSHALCAVAVECVAGEGPPPAVTSAPSTGTRPPPPPESPSTPPASPEHKGRDEGTRRLCTFLAHSHSDLHPTPPLLDPYPFQEPLHLLALNSPSPSRAQIPAQPLTVI
jgi:hypothetical protein